MTESLYRKFKWADFSDLIKKSIQFCSESKVIVKYGNKIKYFIFISWSKF